MSDLPTAQDRRRDCVAIALEAAELLRSRFGSPGEVRDKGDIRERYDSFRLFSQFEVIATTSSRKST